MDANFNRRQALGFTAAGAAGVLLGGMGLTGTHAAASTPPRDSTVANGLVVINQMTTGPWSEENCGPVGAVIAMVASGYSPSGYEEGVNNGRGATEGFRVDARLSPAGDPGSKLVDYWGSDLADLEVGLDANNVSHGRGTFDYGVDRARQGSTVILHVHHGTLIGDPGADYGHYVVAKGTAANGGIAVSDPGRASLGITGYTESHLRNSEVSGRDANRALVVWTKP